jgi:outer membrane lipoprotein SlyB
MSLYPAKHGRTAALTFFLLAASALLAGCAPMISGDAYRRHEVLQPQSVELGIVESARPVRIEGYDTGAGTAGGAVIGGLAGSQIGSGSGSVAAALGGAILGAIAGNAIERDANRRNGVEVMVRLDSGRLVAVVQQDGGEGFRPGDRIRLVSNGYATRVTR